ncbi:GGDEF domain-containing protein [Devosia submarina]|uniref:GGDEF domain-containing protein n=1 Tax=Devosia submarina TaxID=1173082 RepID=UPI000D3A0975|nr:GGDEF domain-containing protein [Devosia submarina]
MPGQFFFSLLNPVLSLVLAATFFAIWTKRPRLHYLPMMGTAFLFNGLGFALNDLLRLYEGEWLRAAANFAFFAAISLACISALRRANIGIPVLALAALFILTAAAFHHYLIVEPSLEARIYVVSAAYAVMTGYTSWLLIRAKPSTLVDWILFAFIMLIFLFAVARPTATWLGTLDLNEGGTFTSSDYWATVVAFTPMLAVAAALAFIAAVAGQIMIDLRKEANQDYLTGLLNRRGFDKEVLALMPGSGTIEAPAAVMIADIDNFKEINDTFGHAVGDEVIALVAKVLSTIGRPNLVGRTGGEEFALFFQQLSRNALLRTAESISEHLSTARLNCLPEGRHVTVSIGIHIRDQQETLSEMMSKADAALYRAKSEGKNCAIMSPHVLRTLSGGSLQRASWGRPRAYVPFGPAYSCPCFTGSARQQHGFDDCRFPRSFRHALRSGRWSFRFC